MQAQPSDPSPLPSRPPADPLDRVDFPEIVLVIPRPWNTAMLERLLEDPGRALLLRVSRVEVDALHSEWHALEVLSDRSALGRAAAGECFLLVRTHTGEGLMPYIENDLANLPESVVGVLFYGSGAWLGKAWGAVRTADGTGFAAFARLTLPGAGMEVLELMANPQPPPALTETEREQHSRTIGAFGPGGEAVFCRERCARYVVAGNSRSGGFFGEALMRLGASFTLIDPKRLARNHLGEISPLLREADLGRFKAEAFAERLAACQPSYPAPQALPSRLHSREGADAVRRSDVLIEAGDSDALRISASILSRLYNKVHCSVATGIHYDAAGQCIRGSDIRLILPGTGRCLLCYGGVADYQRGLRELLHDPRGETGDDFRRERAGSSRALNQLATGLAMEMINDLFIGRLRITAGSGLNSTTPAT